MLCELAKAEGMKENLVEMRLNGKTVEKLSNDFIRKPPDTGVWEGTYACPVEKENLEFREALGRKYLDWVEDDEDNAR